MTPQPATPAPHGTYLPNGRSAFSRNRKVYYNGLFYSVWVHHIAYAERITFVYRLMDTSLVSSPVIRWDSKRKFPTL